MKLLPREHGATAIWFASLLLAFGTLRKLPSLLSVVVFLASATLVLVLMGTITSRSVAIIRLERNAILLPVASSLLTLIVPLGQMIMVGAISIQFLALWFAFLAYCSTGVAYARDLVRSVLKERPQGWTGFSVSFVFTIAVVAILNAVNWLSIAALATLVPLTVHRVVVVPLIERKASSRVERIREVGFSQAGSLISAALILAFLWKP
jgi:hypothetical protein